MNQRAKKVRVMLKISSMSPLLNKLKPRVTIVIIMPGENLFNLRSSLCKPKLFKSRMMPGETLTIPRRSKRKAIRPRMMPGGLSINPSQSL